MSEHAETHQGKGFEIDPATANRRRKISGTSSYYYQIKDLTGWSSDAVYWQGFPPGSSMTLDPAESIPDGTSPPTDAAEFSMGSWSDAGSTLAYTVGKDSVTGIYKLEGQESGKNKGSGYLVVQTQSSPKGEETCNLLWFTLGGTTAPASIITSTKADVIFTSRDSVDETAPDKQTWWQSTDTGS